MKIAVKMLGAILLATTAIAYAADADARTGEEIVTKHCLMCHGTPGIPGAPKTAEEWAARIEAKGGVETLVVTATSGINAMPPKGMCMDCTDAELKAAVEALVQ